jgi:cytochrome c peroxidase
VGAIITAVVLIGQNRRFSAERDRLAKERSQRQAENEQQALESSVESFADRAIVLEVPLGLKAIPIPSNNPLSYAKVELGRLLFFDKRLSLDNTLSCASCHNPALGWADAQPVAVGIGGQKGGRNTPSILNTAHQRFFSGMDVPRTLRSRHSAHC